MTDNPFRRRHWDLPRVTPRRVSPYREAMDRDAAHIMRYLRSNQTQPQTNRENEAILDWLFTPKKKTRTLRPETAGPTPKKGINS